MRRAGVAAIGVAGAAAAGISAMFFGGVSRAAEIARISERFGLPVELMSKLKHAADEAGVSVEEVMGDTSGRFSARIAAAPALSGEQAQAALKAQQDWNAAMRDFQYAMLPAVQSLTAFTEGLAGVAGAMARHKPSTFFGLLFGGDDPRDVGANAIGAGGRVRPPAADLSRLKAIAQAANPTGVKGAFQTFGAMGRFGFGDNNSEVKKQTELMKQLVDGKGALPKEIGKELKDALIPK